MQTRLTFVATLQEHSKTRTVQSAFRFLSTPNKDEQTLTFGDLHERALSIGASLARERASGERVLLFYPHGLDFVGALFGCLYAGAVAVPTTASHRLRRTSLRLLSIIRDARPRLGLTDSATLPLLDTLALKHPEVREVKWLATDQIAAIAGRGFEPVTSTPEELAMIQYTSGSTSAPKGVMLSHANLLHNQRAIREGFGQDERSLLVGWLPQFHDMGLIGFILHPVYIGASCVLLSPLSFLQRPSRWLEAITRFRATGTASPNFGFDLCVRKVTPEERERIDLSSLRAIINGSEPVRAETMRRFLDMFAPCGLRSDVFYPSYGLAEATLLVTAPAVPAMPPVVRTDVKTLSRAGVNVLPPEASDAPPINCGRALADQKVRIVDPESLAECEEGEVGEIWVSGESVGQGYWNNPEMSERTFRARLAEDDGLNYLRTGDLGFIFEAQLYVTGRLRDLIIIRGRNFYPQDIEISVEQSTPLCRPGTCAAFSVLIDDTERLVVSLETSRLSEDRRRELIADVRRAIAINHELDVYAVALLEPGTIPKTSSGKIQRFACREAFLAKRFGNIFTFEYAPAQEPSLVNNSIREELLSLPPEERAGRLEKHLRGLLSEIAGVPDDAISNECNILVYGIDSLRATEFLHRLENSLGYVVPSPSALLNGLTLAQLTAQLYDALSRQAKKPQIDELTAEDPPYIYPLSHGQKALWFISRLVPDDIAYNIGGALRISAELDVQALSRALEALVRRHASLRTTFEDSPHEPVQRVHQHFNISVELHDTSEWTDARLAETLSEEFHRPFDLTKDLPLRLSLFTQSLVEHVLLLVIHHIAADFWSLGIIQKELAELYRAEVQGTPHMLHPLRRHYADHVRREKLILDGTEGERLWRYWERQLAGDLTPLDLPTDRRRPIGLTLRGARQTTLLDKSLTESLGRLARAHNTTLFVVLLSAFHLLLHRYSGQSEIYVGTPSVGRNNFEFDRVVGYFANPVVLRSQVFMDDDCTAFLKRMRSTVLDALTHVDIPFPLLVQRLQPERVASVSPIFQAMFVWQSVPSGSPSNFAALALDVPGVRSEWGQWSVESVRFERRAAQFDLSLLMAEYGGQLVSSFEYRPELFDPATIARLQDHFESILRAMAEDSSVQISRLPLLTEDERAQFERWNNTAIEYGEEHVLHRLFELQAARFPDGDALVSDGDALSFAALDRRTNQLAHYLIAQGIAEGDVVGVLLEPGFKMIIGVLAILKAGGAYVPFSPSEPRERLDFMLKDARPSLVVTESKFAELINLEGARVVRLDADQQRIEVCATTHDGLPLVTPDMLAYVIYTSGSTGRPKGVMITHRAICNRLLWMRDEYRVTPADRVLQKTPYTFDVSVWEIFLPLITGASLVIAPSGSHRDPASLAGLICRQNVSLVHFVPSMLAPFLEEPATKGCASLRHLICSGETLTTDLQKLFFRTLDAKLHNLYGPTEAAVDVTYWACRREDENSPVPIGRPIANCQIYVLDELLNQVPIGHPGELCIGGVGLSVGYRGRPELTASSFVPNPFSTAGSGRLYKTGDRARFRADGSIEFLGRLDQQVKMRGVRVEPSETEAALHQHTDVRECIVTATADGDGQQPRLTAYVVPAVNAQLTLADLNRFLARRLSEPFIPTRYQFLSKLPRTPNGKINRRALQSPANLRPDLTTDFAEPETPGEMVLAEIWREVMDVERVGVDDNFFQLGGDSLRVLQVRSRARKMGYEFSVRQIFEAPTIRRLAPLMSRTAETSFGSSAEKFSLVSEDIRRALPPHVEDAYPLSRVQEALVFHSRNDADYEVYVISLHVSAPFDADAFNLALSKVVARHDMLRVSYFLTEQGDYVQMINQQVPLPLEVIDLRGFPRERQESVIRELIESEKRKQFDWVNAPLWRLLIHLRDEHSFQLTLSHPLYDGWSVASTLVELFTEHLGLIDGNGMPSTPPVFANFRDFIAAEQGQTRSAEVRAFWRNKLEGCNASLLPRQPSSRTRQGSEYLRASTTIPTRLVEAAKNLARSEQVPLKSVLLAAHLRVVGLITGQTEILTGLITNGRLDETDGDRVVGMLLNTLPLRANLAAASWAGLVRETFQAEQELWPYRHFPLAEVRSMLGALPFDTAFNFIHFHLYNQLKGFKEFGLRGWESPSDRTYFPLCAYFNLDPLSANLFFFLDYDTSYLSAHEIKNIQAYYLNTLATMTEQPHDSVTRRSLLSAVESHQQLNEWNDRRATHIVERLELTHRLFEARAAERPDAFAVVFDGGALTYGELNRRANQLARYLRRLGVGTETPVGICLERSADLVVCTLAVLKAGGAYVPLDPSHPGERLTFMLKDSAAPVVLTREGLSKTFGAPVKPVLLDRHTEAIARQSDGDLDGGSSLDSLAYIIYTSGSTGLPKGVEVTHAALVNVLLAVGRMVELRREDVLLSVTTLAFDISALELFMPLVTGASIFIADSDTVRDAGRLLELLKSSQATLMQATPAAWHLLLAAGWRGDGQLRILCGGEALPRDLAEELLARAGGVWNLYGPTETTIWCAASKVSPGREPPDIGRPLANLVAYVLDPQLNLLPPGVSGELYVGGIGLARGYCQRPGLTAERFVPDPFSKKPGARLYRTGDLVRYIEGGALVFLGRLDAQIKIRGFRIETGEVEALLLSHPDVGEAVVVARHNEHFDKRLVAYVTPYAGRVPSPAKLHTYLSQRLPDYMIPSAFIVLASLPLTVNGKVDRKALPEVSLTYRRPDDEDDAVQLDGLRLRLVEIWRGVLRLDEVRINDNFFDLGGHSFLALKLQNRLRSELGVDVPPLALFEHPTIKLLAEYLERRGVEAERSDEVEHRARLRRGLHGRPGSVGDRRRDARAVGEQVVRRGDDEQH